LAVIGSLEAASTFAAASIAESFAGFSALTFGRQDSNH
jgi:hypothetical protein